MHGRIGGTEEGLCGQHQHRKWPLQGINYLLRTRVWSPAVNAPVFKCEFQIRFWSKMDAQNENFSLIAFLATRVRKYCNAILTNFNDRPATAGVGQSVNRPIKVLRRVHLFMWYFWQYLDRHHGPAPAL